nr:phage/plasmid replication protein, II/X family [uncultured Undibacterium sp.]
MIDWITATVPFSSATNLNGGRVISCDGDGNVEWQSEKRLPVVGSFESSFHIVSRGDGYLNISGNPIKFIQGHNLFGSDNLIGLVVETMIRICKFLKVPVHMHDFQAWKAGRFSLQRVDIAFMYSLENRANVRAWIRSAEYQSKSRHGRPITRGGTLYFGKHSRRWSIKAYGKADEINSAKSHRLPDEIPNRGDLEYYAEDKLRIELVLRSMQLDDLFLKDASKWSLDTPANLHSTFMGSIDMSDQFSLTASQLVELPPRLVAVYRLWVNGEDLRAMYPKNTFYRYRRQLLKFNIDIVIIQPKLTNNIVPLVRALRPEAVAQVPDWARHTNLYFDPRRTA